ncbi:5-(carboxyamino)imidazole ribonucleotide synthase [Bacillus sp. FSL K6-3431]|uniref:5-(carboxyamino)imidazole ribonucleotide synthase n=1 Tax=Bacillus sp. FSL K6-3431 TaxID=2921500 RepID=UPI0030FB6AD4
MSKKVIEPGQIIGIIGGGQLGRMMTLSAKEAGFHVVVLEPAPDSPAGQIADEQIVAAYDDRIALAELAKKSDVITYEFENIDFGALDWLTKKAYIPQGSELIKITQDRILEKQSLTDAGVEVAPYAVIRSVVDLEEKIKSIGLPSVLKTSRGGYDGKGQFVLKELADMEEAIKLLSHGPCVLEAWIPFNKEISVVMTRSVNGELSCFPIGENIHVNNILHETIVPARISVDVEKNVYLLATKIANHLNLVGTLAVELFLTEAGKLYVNELAPRPHNSGHYTIEACSISQFGQHIRAVCGWPLQDPTLLKPAIMINVLGQHVDGVRKEVLKRPNWSIHFYGKKEAKHNRKMGHVTILTESVDATLQELDESGVWMKEINS